MSSRNSKAVGVSTSTVTAEEAARRSDRVGALVRLLQEHEGQEVPLYKVMEVAGSQHSARIHTARHKLGLNIINRTEVINGVRHSWFKLVPTQKAEPEQVGLFTNQISYSDPEESFRSARA